MSGTMWAQVEPILDDDQDEDEVGYVDEVKEIIEALKPRDLVEYFKTYLSQTVSVSGPIIELYKTALGENTGATVRWSAENDFEAWLRQQIREDYL